MTLFIFFITSLLGGTGSPLIKYSVSVFPTLTFVALRALACSVILLPFVYRQILKPKEVKKQLLLGSLLFAGNWIFFAQGIQKTTVMMGQIIYIPTSLVVAVLGYIFLGEKLKKQEINGLVIIITGLAVLTIGALKAQNSQSFGTASGNTFVVLGLLSWSGFTVVSRKIASYYSTYLITFINFAITGTLATVAILFTGSLINSPLNSSAALAIAAVAISTAGFFLSYQWLLKHASAFIASLTLYPITIFASTLGIIFYNERITLPFFLGSILIVTGVFWATSYQYAKKYIMLWMFR